MSSVDSSVVSAAAGSGPSPWVFGDRLAPDGSLVQGNFDRWFAGSQAVHKDGLPLIAYRGDHASGGVLFTTFDRNQTREHAFFFTQEKEIASIYAHGAEPRAFFLRAERLFELESAEGEKFIRAWAKAWDDDGWIDRQSGEDVDPYDVVLSGRLFDYEGTWSSERWRDLQVSIECAGYDGARLADWDNGTGTFEVLIVFDPLQIKSVDNSGMFDPESADVNDSAAVDVSVQGSAELRRERMRS